MVRFLRPAHVLPRKKERYALPPTVEELAAKKKRQEEYVRDFRLPLEGHAQGAPLPPVTDDPRLQFRRSKPRRRPKAPDIPKNILREGEKNPLGARVPAKLPDETSETAQKIWFPNLRIYMLRNGPKHAGDPYTATFRVPKELNKVDIVQYLRQVYGVGINGIRTVIQYADMIKQPGRHKSIVRKPILKKAIVQLDQPFLYPKQHNPYYLREHFDHPLYGMRTSSMPIVSPDEDMSYPAYKERQARQRRKAEEETIERMRYVRRKEAEGRATLASVGEEEIAIEDTALAASDKMELATDNSDSQNRLLSASERTQTPRDRLAESKRP